MLTRLILHDFVIVRRVEIDLAPGFCVFTGETGAGKSLLVGALALLAGARAAAGVIRPGAAAAEAQAVFDIRARPAVQNFLAAENLGAGVGPGGDDGGELILRRVIGGGGGAGGGKKSAAYINGRQVPLAQLAQVTEMLMDICGQHAHYSLRAAAAQQRLLDAYAGADMAGYTAAYNQWRAADARASEAAAAAEKTDSERARLEEVLAELQVLEWSDDKWRGQNNTLTRAAAAGDLRDGSAQAAVLLAGDGGDGGGAGGGAGADVQTTLAKVRRLLAGMAKTDDSLQTHVDVIDEAEALVTDSARALAAYAEGLTVDPAAGERAEQFVADCHRLARKYGVQDAARLGEFIAERQAEMDRLPTDSDVAALRAAAAEARQEVDKRAGALSKQRQAAAAALSKEVNALLAQLAMARAEMRVQLTAEEAPRAHGMEKTQLLIRTQPGRPPGGIAEVASGGELSRLGLAIQLAAASGRELAVSVFDEVDAGIGGGAAGTVGALLRRLGEARQVICITHLPQIAACAQAQWRVAGGDDITRLSGAGRVEEIARMQSGEKITDAARRHAEEMLRDGG